MICTAHAQPAADGLPFGSSVMQPTATTDVPLGSPSPPQMPIMFSIGAGSPKPRTTLRPRRRIPPHR